jgi:hypothetical protein
MKTKTETEGDVERLTKDLKVVSKKVLDPQVEKKLDHELSMDQLSGICECRCSQQSWLHHVLCDVLGC